MGQAAFPPPAFHRRIAIDPSPGCVVAELEDDWHRMVVTMRHDDQGVATAVEGVMKRWPWTTCPGAIAQLAQTFTGHPLTAFARRGEKSANCTHLHDLAVFAAAHAGETAPITYDIVVTDPTGGRREARMVRNGQPIMAWQLEGAKLLAPQAIAGATLYELAPWIATLDAPMAEAARILRWAAILGFGRGMDMPAGMSATAFPGSACFTFQPDMAATALRRPGADVDFSHADGQSSGPLFDRAHEFSALPYGESS